MRGFETTKKPDVNGQVHPIETAELLGFKLEELQSELDALPLDQTAYVRQAQERCPELLTDKFKLLFLRCDVFDAKVAAKRYAKYWKKRVDIIGKDKAFQPLRLDGNLRDILDVFELGVINVIECSESSGGRTIVYVRPTRFDKNIYTIPKVLRMIFYMTHAALENEETARKGMIVIGNQKGMTLAQADRKLVAAAASLKDALPVRLSAYHICHPAWFMAKLWSFVRLLLGGRLFNRIHLHTGSDEEIADKLKKYGVDIEDIPESLGGEHVVDILKWLQLRRMNEESPTREIEQPVI